MNLNTKTLGTLFLVNSSVIGITAIGYNSAQAFSPDFSDTGYIAGCYSETNICPQTANVAQGQTMGPLSDGDTSSAGSNSQITQTSSSSANTQTETSTQTHGCSFGFEL